MEAVIISKQKAREILKQHNLTMPYTLTGITVSGNGNVGIKRILDFTRSKEVILFYSNGKEIYEYL